MLKLSDVSFQSPGKFSLESVSFSQKQGERVAIAGTTGSGKSTLLKIIAGLIQSNSGTLSFFDETLTGPSDKLIAGHAGIAYLSQVHELRKSLRVGQVLEYASQVDDALFQKVISICRIDHLLERRTNEVSGGEQQRIAFATLLLGRPILFLLDEPFSNLDIVHKRILKSVIDDASEQLGISFILVSHDPQDTMSWADKIVILKDGRIIQQGSPEEVYQQPADEYAAALFGSYNLLPLRVVKKMGAEPQAGKNFLIRPEAIRLSRSSSKGYKMKIHAVRFLGAYDEIELRSESLRIMVLAQHRLWKRGDIAFAHAPLKHFTKLPSDF